MPGQPEKQEYNNRSNRRLIKTPGADYDIIAPLNFINLESGGVRRLVRPVDWETMVDALYAPQDRFSLN